MGCKTCRSECGREDGCGSRKATQKELLLALLTRLYPSRCWGEAEPRAALEDGLQLTEVVQLASRIAAALRTPAYVLPGGEDDLCAFIYVLCLGREPSVLELREGLLQGPPEGSSGEALASDKGLWLEADTLRERYLRISCSMVGRLFCVQEVAMELSTRGPDCPPGMATIREIPLPGVFDPILLKRFQRTVDLLQAHGVEHLDMGLLDVEAAAFSLMPGDYLTRFGAAPALLNYLFYAMPVQTVVTSFLSLLPTDSGFGLGKDAPGADLAKPLSLA